MANYTLSATGTAANKAAAVDGDPSVNSECMSIATHNGETFSPGDVIMLADDGGDYRATLTTPSAGSSGNEITYQAYSGDTPIISGADLITGWTVYSGSVYQATVTTQPQQLFIDGTLGDRKTSIGGCVAEYDWYWASNVCYLYAPGDPDTQYTTPGVEGGARQYCILIVNDYITVDGITVKYANHRGIGRGDTSVPSYWTIKNCILEWNWYSGVHGLGASGNFTGWIIEDNVARYNGSTGISLQGCTGTNIIRRNEVYENSKYQSDEDIDETFIFGGGIKLFDVTPGTATYGTEIYENKVYSNGRGDSDSNEGQGVGIWHDYCIGGDSSHRNTIRHNLVYDNDHGIFVEISTYSAVHNNLIYDNGLSHGDTDASAPAQLTVDCRYDFDGSYNLFYNNTCVGGRYGIKARSYGTGNHQLEYNEFKNNVVVGQSLRVLYANRGGDNDGIEGDFNVYDNNCFGAEFTDFIRWGGFGADYSTYDSWETAHGESWVQIKSDPSFTDADNDDYALVEDSLCVGAGDDLGSPYNIALLPSSLWPSEVLTGDQDDY